MPEQALDGISLRFGMGVVKINAPGFHVVASIHRYYSNCVNLLLDF